MPKILEITNHGPLITGSNYWQSEMAANGMLYLSVNAGAFRLLVPSVHRAVISDMRKGAKYAVLSFLPLEKWQDGQYCAEWMIEDGSADPWSCHLSPGQVDRCPTSDDVAKPWIASVWDLKKGRPHKCLERLAHCQIVPSLPWLKKIEQ